MDKHTSSPFTMYISFNKLMESYEMLAKSDDTDIAARAKEVLEIQKEYPELREGFTEFESVHKYQEVIDRLLQDSFSPILTYNEIKTAGVPFEGFIFKSSKRFDNIVSEAGDDFSPKFREIPDNDMYIMACSVILSFYYGRNVQFRRPLYYDIPDSQGIMKHYRVTYNADFMEIYPTENAVDLDEGDIDELLNGFDNIELWKEKFPPGSWVAKGFVISNIFDVTIDNSISELKTGLLNTSAKSSLNLSWFTNVFKSIYGIPDLKIGFSAYEENTKSFERINENVPSYLLEGESLERCEHLFCGGAKNALLNNHSYFAISDIDRYVTDSGDRKAYDRYKKQGYKSIILAPVARDGELLGVLELLSPRRKELNSVNANKLNDVMPFIVTAVARNRNEEANRIEAVIQNECTSIHDSVKWKFVEEARHFLREKEKGNMVSFREISFKDVHPLYGQIDIRNSSEERNSATRRDLLEQLSLVEEIMDLAIKHGRLPIYEEYNFRIMSLIDNVRNDYLTNTEQDIINFLFEEIHPVLPQLRTISADLNKKVLQYEERIDSKSGMINTYRNKYDNTVNLINRRMARLLDQKHEEAYAMFPHYFERYKTDGVEHTMYIGASISKDREYSEVYLQNLRLWQLETMCHMENVYYNLKPELEIPLDVTSMILVHSNPLAIKFRMDEKHFDVDGSYNARYEILKKRIDKSLILGTDERITKPGHITIVYGGKNEEREYLRYVRLLQSKGILAANHEIHEIDNTQGVSGLKALRVGILYRHEEHKSKLTYEDLMQELAKSEERPPEK
ncbi:GAF domain-containing protein [Robertkochia aurantiaca]|uniref:GAF domain-containing protein n=1 Tax=Robertkochia aurantiaca TaxID=2873700 RepID=UPI001CCE2B34|nr:GAF domain-containing protein [Robertkochia sp. 3YJGBD-33]